MKLRVQIEGLREIEAALRALPDSTAKGVARRVLKSRAEPIAAAMRERAPVLRGALRDSIAVSTRLSRRQRRLHVKPDPNDIEVYVGPGTNPEAIAQEFGTSRHPAQPFARPAWDLTHRAALDGIGADLWVQIEKTVARRARRAARRAAKGRG